MEPILPLPSWMLSTGPRCDVAISTRCRVARNVAGQPFPWRAGEAQRKAIAEMVLEAAERAGGVLARPICLAAERLSAATLARVIELRYASPAWGADGPYRRLLVARDGTQAAMVNEEDHVRLSVIAPGLQVESVLEAALETERGLAQTVSFARSPAMGWLTASPANAGTGVRVSALLHLPGLAAAGALSRSLRAAEDVGASVRGLYGEGSLGTGSLVQVSTTRALGANVTVAIARLKTAVDCVVSYEVEARERLYLGREGRQTLAADAESALVTLFASEPDPPELLELVSLLRLAAAEGVLNAPLPALSECIALAGLAAALPDRADGPAQRYESVWRSAAVRARIRALVRPDGTTERRYAK